MEERWEAQQAEICGRFGVEPVSPDPERNCGVSRDILEGAFLTTPVWPLNGCRHLPTTTTTGWFIWTGDLSTADDFFVPLHSSHLEELCAPAVPYLGLPPGWRFLLAPGYEDVWFDESLLVE